MAGPIQQAWIRSRGGGANEIVVLARRSPFSNEVEEIIVPTYKILCARSGPKVRKPSRFRAAGHIIRSCTFHFPLEPHCRPCCPASPCGNVSEMIPVRVPTTGQK